MVGLFRMEQDLRAQLTAFQGVVDTASREFDRLSEEQRTLLRAALRRIEDSQITAIRKSLGIDQP